MSNNNTAAETDAATVLRTTPVQQRSNARVQKIEAAARIVVARSGRDRFTTGEVAKEAKSSIGTIYRYFPNRVAILDHIWPDRRDNYPGVDA